MMAGQFNRCQQFDGSAASCHVALGQPVPSAGQRPNSGVVAELDGVDAVAVRAHELGRREDSRPLWRQAQSGDFLRQHRGDVRRTRRLVGHEPGPECVTNDLPAGQTDPVLPNDMSVFNAAVGHGQTAQFNLVVPNECEDAHDNCPPAKTAIAQFDAFLQREVPVIQNADPQRTDHHHLRRGHLQQGPGQFEAVRRRRQHRLPGARPTGRTGRLRRAFEPLRAAENARRWVWRAASSGERPDRAHDRRNLAALELELDGYPRGRIDPAGGFHRPPERQSRRCRGTDRPGQQAVEAEPTGPMVLPATPRRGC